MTHPRIRLGYGQQSQISINKYLTFNNTNCHNFINYLGDNSNENIRIFNSNSPPTINYRHRDDDDDKSNGRSGRNSGGPSGGNGDCGSFHGGSGSDKGGSGSSKGGGGGGATSNNTCSSYSTQQTDIVVNLAALIKNKHKRELFQKQLNNLATTLNSILDEGINEHESRSFTEWKEVFVFNEESCDKTTQCGILKRIVCIIQYYTQWVKRKGNNMIRDLFNELKFNNTSSYTYVNLCNDFEHIRDVHMKLNTPQTLITIEYFDKLLGKCIDKECCSLARHCRDRHIDNIDENKRRQIFFIKKDSDKIGELNNNNNNNKLKVNNNKKNKVINKQNTVRENKMYFEINLQTKLDTIHITLRHHHLRLINTDKFITKISGIDGDGGGDNNSRGDATAEEIYSKMTKYSFGESITYWDSKHHRYCSSKYADLRSELLNNKIYSLSYNLYSTIKTRAISFLATKKGIKLLSLREHDWMKKWKILLKSQITLDHIIALLCYVNVTALRRVFKLHGFIRVKGRDSLLDRHHEIWHWSR
eukprot:513784_1